MLTRKGKGGVKEGGKERCKQGEEGGRGGRKEQMKEPTNQPTLSFTTQNDVLFNKTPVTRKQSIEKVNKFLNT